MKAQFLGFKISFPEGKKVKRSHRNCFVKQMFYKAVCNFRKLNHIYDNIGSRGQMRQVPNNLVNKLNSVLESGQKNSTKPPLCLENLNIFNGPQLHNVINFKNTELKKKQDVPRCISWCHNNCNCFWQHNLLINHEWPKTSINNTCNFLRKRGSWHKI